LEKEDISHSFSSRVFLYYYKFFFKNYSLFGFFIFVKKNFLKLFYCISLSLMTANFKIVQFSGELALLFCGKFKPATTKIKHVSTKFPK